MIPQTIICTIFVLSLQSNAAMTAEMKALKAQVKELKNMMKMSFDLQMDIQRSIRQEVAAAMCNATGVCEGGAIK